MTKETQIAVILHYLPLFIDNVKLLTGRYIDKCNSVLDSDDERILDILEIFYDICKR